MPVAMCAKVRLLARPAPLKGQIAGGRRCVLDYGLDAGVRVAVHEAALDGVPEGAVVSPLGLSTQRGQLELVRDELRVTLAEEQLEPLHRILARRREREEVDAVPARERVGMHVAMQRDADRARVTAEYLEHLVPVVDHIARLRNEGQNARGREHM